MEIGGVKIKWLGHSGFLLEGPKLIYIDPFKISSFLPKADIILLTHDHYDHCSVEDIEKIIKPGTKIFLTPGAQSKIVRFKEPINMQVICSGEEFLVDELKISAVPAYNIDKPFHLKDEELIGYVLKFENVTIYHAGDTDKIPEMQKLTGFNKNLVALLPIGGRFTMDAYEAFEAAKLIKPTIAIPMHWGSIIGTLEDAKEFKELCESKNISVEILERE